MAIVVNSGSRQQRQMPQREGILEILGRGLAEGAGQSLGTGLGNLATQGLGRLMDPNMRTLDAQTLEMLGLDPQQAQAVASIKNPSVQQYLIDATQKRQAESQDKLLKQQQNQQYAGVLNKFLPQQGVEGTPQAAQPITEEDVKDLELKHIEGIVRHAEQQQKIVQKEKHANEANVRSSWAETKKSRDKAREAAEEAEKGEGIVNNMEKLEASGKLSSGLIPGLLEKAGLDALLDPTDQTFIKLRTAFMSGAKKAIGGRVTNFELDNFMKSVPSLMQSPEGRRMIIENMRAGFDLDKKYYDTQRKVINKYKDKPLPYDFDEQVYEAMKPAYKEFQDKFKIVGQSEGKSEQNMPPVAQFAGKTVRNKSTGQLLKSNGTEWIPVNEEQKPVKETPKLNMAPSGNRIGQYPWMKK